MKSLGVGLVGTGFMGKCHALAWNAVKPVFGDGARPRLVHLADVSGELAAARASEFGFERASGNWRALIADPEVDVVSVTTPNQFHSEMAVAALEAGKHVWCEKPMAPTLAEAVRMREAARRPAGSQCSATTTSRTRRFGISGGSSTRTQLAGSITSAWRWTRISWPTRRRSSIGRARRRPGYGALDDFGVHPISLITTLLTPITRVFAHQAKPYVDRPLKGGGRRIVETHDIAAILFELAGDISGVLALNRSAWGRKGRIAIQIFGARGAILFDQERMNEVQLYTTADRGTEQGFRTILTAPHHPPYDRFIPAPGHGLGFNDLKIIECRQLMNLIEGKPAVAMTFEEGVEIERTVHAMARSHAEQRWISVADVA